MYTHFLILATQLTNLSLKTSQRRDPYLNFNYLQLALPTRGFIAIFAEKISLLFEKYMFFKPYSQQIF